MTSVSGSPAVHLHRCTSVCFNVRGNRASPLPSILFMKTDDKKNFNRQIRKTAWNASTIIGNNYVSQNVTTWKFSLSRNWTFNYYNHSKQELIETEDSLLSRILLMNFKYVTYSDITKAMKIQTNYSLSSKPSLCSTSLLSFFWGISMNISS